jgi:2,3,4,5-tetrahydropyridine-2,6-dicarboxylate N-succinyltransferase
MENAMQLCLVGWELFISDRAGIYVTAATKVTLPGGQVVKALELSGHSSLLFIRNSVTGAIEVRRRQGKTVELNEALHAN